MKRWAVQICVLLLLGAIVNVAVAWACSFGLRYRSDVSQAWEDEQIPLLLSAHGWSRTGNRSITGQVRCFGAMEGQATMMVGRSAVEALRVVRTGWPSYALEGNTMWPRSAFERWSQSGASTKDYGIVTAGAWQHETTVHYPTFKARGSIVVPWLPIWPGFAINTVFYTFVLWLLFAAPFALRRRRRIKRGLCPKCAYPVGTNDVCTECGAAVR